MQGDLRLSALRWLIEFKLSDGYDRKKNGTLSAKKDIFPAFYKDVKNFDASLVQGKPEDVQDALEGRGKKLFGDLADALDAYYGGPGASDPIKIELKRGHGGLYEPLIERRATARSSESELSPTDAQTGQRSESEMLTGSLVDCRHFGNDREAMQYVLERYRAQSPRLAGIRDTHVRAEMPMRYRENYYDELHAAFRNFLNRGDPDLTVCTLVFGWEVDTAYVRMVHAAASGSGDRLKCYRLRNRGPLMNFILLDYDDLSTEVLFGWGQGKPGRPGAVFRSKDKRLVGEFGHLYDELMQASDRIPVETLLESHQA